MKLYLTFIIPVLPSYISAVYGKRTMCFTALSNSKYLRGKTDNSSVSSRNLLQEEMRYDGIGHIISKREKQRRCKMKECSSKPKTFCQKCEVTLCISCFPKYHEKMG